jgi:hypothetical protein
MKLSDVNKILAESSQEDWIVDDESGSFTYKNDLNLHIQRADYDPKAMAVEYIVKYGSSFVDKHTLVSVDGHRATLPMPRSIADLSIMPSDVNFARIVSVGGRVDEYIRRSNLKVDDNE